MEKKIFGSVIPAPNPTGELHLGHFLNLSIQDLFCRWRRTQGCDIKWALALDHGGSSTEYVATKNDKNYIQNCSDRKYISNKITSWVDGITPTILEQIDKMNLIIDSDEFRSMADSKREYEFLQFISQMAKSGTIYKSDRVIPWCTDRQSFVDIADIVKSEHTIYKYSLIYKSDENEKITIDSEDLSLLLNETIILMSEDFYQRLHGSPKFITNPLGENIKIIVSDKLISLFSGKEIVSITPGHCINSYFISLYLNEKISRAFNEGGYIEKEGEYFKVHKEDVEKRLLEVLQSSNLVSKIQKLNVMADTFRLSGKRVESLLSRQCFFDVSSLAKDALEKIRKGTVDIKPSLYKQALENYLEELNKPVFQSFNESVFLRDICISQQLVCGTDFSLKSEELRFKGDKYLLETQIPKEEVYVATMRLSCALWAFSAQMVYEKEQAKLENLGQNSVCVTGMDLTTFWIAPILMMSDEIGFAPFKTVYIHPLITDTKGRKMSKSFGNTETPDTLIDNYDVDSVRLSLFLSIDNSLHRVIVDKSKIDSVHRNLKDFREKIVSKTTDKEKFEIDSLINSSTKVVNESLQVSDIQRASSEIEQLLKAVISNQNTLSKRQVFDIANVIEPFLPETSEFLNHSLESTLKD
ncbi:hypothetical protein CEE45_16565 [Candidatus Heimdallarchaeota archaeon B3_Heim]|nr:MAG: hypothetical protein CEE45_16565 [Candidatus Heimdallarchaeota archaeon B3_Heim]